MMKIEDILPISNVALKLSDSIPNELSELIFNYTDSLDLRYATDTKLGAVTAVPVDNKKFRYLVSLGDQKKSTNDAFRKAAAAFTRWYISHDVVQVGLDTEQPSLGSHRDNVRAVLEGLCLGGFKFNRYLTRTKKEKKPISILVKKSLSFKDLEREIERACILGESVDLARDWIHEPANKINPQVLEERARLAAQAFGLACQVVQYDELVAMGAGGITAVGRGSAIKSRLIMVEYHGGGSTPPISLVGKAITFDTGGYSLKGSDFIQGMKYDKAGGISVLATIIAAARLKLHVNLVAVIPAAENMISGDSYRPDDILTLLSGLTVEIVSTDAEGRLILADALAYTQNAHKPKTILDIATLTGGVKVALGTLRAGLLSNSDKLAGMVSAAGEITGEKVWRLPLDDEYFDLLKSEDADMKNSGPREAQTIVGAVFLKQVVSDDTPWAHLDIAAAAECETEKAWCAKGANGFGIRLMLETIERLIQE